MSLPLPILNRPISFDVGRYDAYGVYRFERLASVAREDPDLVLAALEPLLGGVVESRPSRTDSEASS